MARIPSKVVERLAKTIGKFQSVLQIAKDRDVNESDTVAIVGDILAEVFGYDKYLEITSEFAVRSTYCDLAIRVDNKIQFMVEVKAIGTDLKESHLRQAVEYGANEGVQWIILTNGILWEIYKIRFEKPIDYDLVCSIDFPQINARKTEDQEKLFIVCKEGLSKDAREDFHEKVQSINRFVIGAIILSDPVVNTVRKELRRISEGIKIENSEIEKFLKGEVLKRDVIEGEEADKAQNRVKRYYSRAAQKPKKEGEQDDSAPPIRQEQAPSFSEQLLKDAEKEKSEQDRC